MFLWIEKYWYHHQHKINCEPVADFQYKIPIKRSLFLYEYVWMDKSEKGLKEKMCESARWRVKWRKKHLWRMSATRQGWENEWRKRVQRFGVQEIEMRSAKEWWWTDRCKMSMSYEENEGMSARAMVDGSKSSEWDVWVENLNECKRNIKDMGEWREGVWDEQGEGCRGSERSGPLTAQAGWNEKERERGNKVVTRALYVMDSRREEGQGRQEERGRRLWGYTLTMASPQQLLPRGSMYCLL